jgi:S1-C subfamily serine protease
MKVGEFKLEEFLRVTLMATLLVIGSRWLFNYTDFGTWVEEIWQLGQQRVTGIVRDRNSTSTPATVPATINAANRSVVMLTGSQSIGSGVILTSNGLILTNSHVVREGGNRWTVRFADARELPAHVVAVGNRDSGIYYDLALVQVEGATNLPTAQFSETTPQPGDQVWAIGSPYGRADVITQGQVKRVTLDGVLLTSTEVHPGNSGGPLLNQNGEVIGINTEINPRMPADATTASISVPVLEKYLPQLINQ